MLYHGGRAPLLLSTLGGPTVLEPRRLFGSSIQNDCCTLVVPVMGTRRARGYDRVGCPIALSWKGAAPCWYGARSLNVEELGARQTKSVQSVFVSHFGARSRPRGYDTVRHPTMLYGNKKANYTFEGVLHFVARLHLHVKQQGERPIGCSFRPGPTCSQRDMMLCILVAHACTCDPSPRQSVV